MVKKNVALVKEICYNNMKTKSYVQEGKHEPERT